MIGIAGVVSAVAQNVYSVNVVGYMTLTLGPGFSLIANQLDNVPGPGNDLATNVFGAGPFPANAKIYKYNASLGSYEILTWVTVPTQRWNPTSLAQTMTMEPGEGVFFQNPSANPLTVTFVGEVMQSKGSPLVNPVGVGFDIYSTMVPQQGGITTVHNFQANPNERIWRYNPATGSYSSASWVTVPTPRWNPSEPVINVGEAFFIQSTAARDWTRMFDVQ